MRLIVRKYLFKAEFSICGIILICSMNSFASFSRSQSAIFTKQTNGNSSVSLRSGTTVLTDYDVNSDSLIDYREISIPGIKITIINPSKKMLGTNIIVERKRKDGIFVELNLRYNANSNSFRVDDLKEVYREDMFFDVDEEVSGESAAICDVKAKPMGDLPAVAGKINQAAVATNDAVNALVSNSCGAQKAPLVAALGELLGAQKTQKPRFMACLAEISNNWLGPFQKTSLNANLLLSQALIERKEIISCSSQIGPAKCGKVPGSEQKIIINGQCLTAPESVKKGKEILFHEILHVAGVSDESVTRSIEKCCLDGFSLENPVCKYGQTFVEPQAAQLAQDQMAIAKSPSKAPPPQKIATFNSADVSGEKLATLETPSGTTYVSSVLTGAQEATVSAAAEVAYSFGRTIDRLDGLVISRAEAREPRKRQLREASVQRREPASIAKRTSPEGKVTEPESLNDTSTSKLHLIELNSSGGLLPASESLLASGSKQSLVKSANSSGTTSAISATGDERRDSRQSPENDISPGGKSGVGSGSLASSRSSGDSISGSGGSSGRKLTQVGSATGGRAEYSERARSLFRHISQSNDRIGLLRSSKFGKQLSAEGIQITTEQESFGSLTSPNIIKSLDDIVGEKW